MKTPRTKFYSKGDVIAWFVLVLVTSVLKGWREGVDLVSFDELIQRLPLAAVFWAGGITLHNLLRTRAK